ncbi:MAG: tRNA pseudouridine(38-40) synthase TruA [Chloroflexota bacterium]
MARYQVILAYDGAQFYGFQRQASGREGRTVQGVVEDALRRLDGQAHSLLGSGRTDTGVHASGQVIAFDLEWRHGPDALRSALNAHLPADVAAQEVREADPAFHPRYDARYRRYRYRIFCHPVRDPLREHFAWRIWPPVAVERMRLAAAALPGTHDFAAFGTPPRAAGSTVRTVRQADWLENEAGELIFEISANAFLYHMARRLVGFQVEIGRGRLPSTAVGQLLQAPPTTVVQALAPAHGLELVEVVYEE